MEEYIWQQRNTTVRYIATRSLLDLREGSERAPGAWVGMRWWEQAGINITGAREAAAVAAEKDGGEEWWRGINGGLPGRINSNKYTKLI